MGAQPVFDTNVLLTKVDRAATTRGPRRARLRGGVGAARPVEPFEKVGQ
jgi:hypothetical protein